MLLTLAEVVDVPGVIWALRKPITSALLTASARDCDEFARRIGGDLPLWKAAPKIETVGLDDIPAVRGDIDDLGMTAGFEVDADLEYVLTDPPRGSEHSPDYTGLSKILKQKLRLVAGDLERAVGQLKALRLLLDAGFAVSAPQGTDPRVAGAIRDYQDRPATGSRALELLETSRSGRLARIEAALMR